MLKITSLLKGLNSGKNKEINFSSTLEKSTQAIVFGDCELTDSEESFLPIIRYIYCIAPLRTTQNI
jgi:hypothetical protein